MIPIHHNEYINENMYRHFKWYPGGVVGSYVIECATRYNVDKFSVNETELKEFVKKLTGKEFQI